MHDMKSPELFTGSYRDIDETANKPPVLIIGAGPAGLTAAYELIKLGYSATILESGDQAGGISKTVSYKGYRFDIGGHRFFSKVSYVNKLWREWLGDDFLERPRLSRIYYNGHFFEYPLKPVNALRGLGLWEAGRVLTSYIKAQLSPQPREENFEDWVRNRFGYRLYNIFFKTYTEKVWGIACRDISADWAAQRIKNLSLQEALRNAFFSSRLSSNGEIITTLIERFHYPRLGPGMMWETCKDLLTAQGVSTRHGQFVYRIGHEKNRVTSVWTKTASGKELSFTVEQVISSMPLREMILSLDPSPPSHVLEAAQLLRYRDYLTVVLIVNRENVFPDNWIYIHSPEVKLGRIQNYKNWSPEMVPEPGMTALGLEYFLWEKDEEWGWPDEKLIELGKRECLKLGLIHPEEVLDGTVVRMKKAYPVYDQYYHDSLETIRQYLAAFQNLQTIGRNGLHRYNNQDHSMMTGVYAARNIVQNCYDVWSVNTEQAYHENGDFKQASTIDRLTPFSIDTATSEDIEQDAAAGNVLDDFFLTLDPFSFGSALGIVSAIFIFLATAILLLKGESALMPKLSLLNHFLLGFETNWRGAIIGSFEAGVGGFLGGYVVAWLRNTGYAIYTAFVRNRQEIHENIDILDKV